jgi:lipid-A-disaccharide synthase
MLKAAGLLYRERPQLSFPVSVAPGIDPDLIRRIVRESAGEADRFPLFPGEARALFRRCAMVIAVSGTVTLEAAIAGIPMVIVYRVSPISYILGKALVRVSHFGLVNLIAGKGVVPELLQEAATPEAISETVSGMLRDPDRFARMRRELQGVTARLGPPGASERVAGIALGMLKGDR